LVFDNRNQALDGEAKISSSGAQNENDYFFVVDLSQAYGIGRVQRRFDLIGDRSLKITDEIESASPHQILWNMLTQADVELKGNLAILSQNGRTISARLLSPTEGRFEILSGSGPPPEAQSPALKRLAVVLPPTTHAQIVVDLGTRDQP
jgi:hypothetical protein